MAVDKSLMGRTTAVLGKLVRSAVWIGSALAVATTAHIAYNRKRFPAANPAEPCAETVSLIIPARNEAETIQRCLAHVGAQQQLSQLEVIVVDDNSTDDTYKLASEELAQMPQHWHREVFTADPLPEGWLGKPAACWAGVQRATGSVIAFIDADVTLEPAAISRAVSTLRTQHAALVSPFLHQACGSWSEYLMQPLIQWAFLATNPLGVAWRTKRPEMAVANGQFLVADAHAYLHVDGHRAVRRDVLEDISLMRTFLKAGLTSGPINGQTLGTCRMYQNWPELRRGYAKSLWSAFGGVAGTSCVATILTTAFVVPAVAALAGNPVGMVGYGAAVLGRYLSWRDSRDERQPLTPAQLVSMAAHPAAIATFVALQATSHVWHATGKTQWRGRTI